MGTKIEHYRAYLARAIIAGELVLTQREWRLNGCQTFNQLKGEL